MNKKKILKYNPESFINDIKRVHGFFVFTNNSCVFFEVRKTQVLKYAETGKIKYYITDKVFLNKRNIMVIH